MPGSGPARAVVDPTTGEPYAEARDSTDDDVDAACRAAADALPGWRATTPSERSRALLRAADVWRRTPRS